MLKDFELRILIALCVLLTLQVLAVGYLERRISVIETYMDIYRPICEECE